MLSSPLEFSLSFKFHKALLLLFWTVITLNFTHIFTLSSSTIHFLLHYCGIIFLLKKLFNISYVGLLDTIYISFCVSKNVFVFPSFLNISAVYKILDLVIHVKNVISFSCFHCFTWEVSLRYCWSLNIFSDFKISLLSFVFSIFTNIFLNCDFIYFL